MQKFKTLFKERKNIIKAFENVKFEEPTIWMLVEFGQRPMANTNDSYWFVLRVYDKNAEPEPLSPFDSVVINEDELKEYFEEIPE